MLWSSASLPGTLDHVAQDLCELTIIRVGIREAQSGDLHDLTDDRDDGDADGATIGVKVIEVNRVLTVSNPMLRKLLSQ